MTITIFYVCLQNFKREEQNFVVQNEINNLSFLTGDNKTKMSKVGFMFAESVITQLLKFIFLSRQQIISHGMAHLPI